MGGVGLVGLGLHGALHHELVVVKVAGVGMYAGVAPHVLRPEHLLAGHQGLVELLAVAGADDLGARAPEHLLHRLGEVAHGGGRGLLDEEVARPGVLEGEEHQVDGLVEVHEEAGHIGVGDREGQALPDAVDEEADHAAAGAHDVAVPGAANGRVTRPVPGVGVDHRLHHGLGLAHGVHRVGRLVGGEAHHLLHALVYRRVQDVVGAQDVGPHGLHREELAGGDLLKRRRVEHVVDTSHGVAHAPLVAHVAYVEADLAGVLGIDGLQPVAHVILLLLVAGEDADLAYAAIQEVLEHRGAEAAGAAGYHEGGAREGVATNHPKCLIIVS